MCLWSLVPSDECLAIQKHFPAAKVAMVNVLTTKRGKEGGWVVKRLLNQLLKELDGSDKRPGVFIIGARNRPEVMDPDVRPGRFGKLLHVSLPSPEDRGLILKALAKGKPIDADADFSAIGQMEACEAIAAVACVRDSWPALYSPSSLRLHWASGFREMSTLPNPICNETCASLLLPFFASWFWRLLKCFYRSARE